MAKMVILKMMMMTVVDWRPIPDGAGSDRRSSGSSGDAGVMVLTEVVFGGSSLGLFRFTSI
ncbi:hypothetical protein Hanom_Chr08g00702971 [Helianthus anomalus]